MITRAYRPYDLMKAIEVKKLGIYDALPGWTYRHRTISKIQFSKYQIVRYIDGNGEIFASFQGDAYLDD